MHVFKLKACISILLNQTVYVIAGIPVAGMLWSFFDLCAIKCIFEQAEIHNVISTFSSYISLSQQLWWEITNLFIHSATLTCSGIFHTLCHSCHKGFIEWPIFQLIVGLEQSFLLKCCIYHFSLISEGCLCIVFTLQNRSCLMI